MAALEKIDIVVKVPINELKFLEDQGFFGKSRDQWFTKTIHEAIVRELDNLAVKDHDNRRVRALEKKYDLVPQEVKDFFGKE